MVGKPESLDDAVFDIQPIESTVSDYKKEIDNPNTFVIMLTVNTTPIITNRRTLGVT